MRTAFIAIFSGVAIGVAVFFMSSGGQEGDGNNVTIVDGTQIVEIRARGGYSPRFTNLKADMPTVLKVDTRGTFDCSAAVTIPAINYYNTFPASGLSEIDIPPQKAGTKMQGLCAMGMYSFVLNFD